MKLLHVINSLEIGGAQRLLSDLIPLQINQGGKVTVVVSKLEDNNFSKKILNTGAKIILIENISPTHPTQILKLRRIIKEHDIVHVHLFPSLYWVALASLGLNQKLFYTEHSTSNRRREKPCLRPLEKFIYRQYHKIISISKQTQRALQRWLQSQDDRFVVINNGVDTQNFSAVKKDIIPKSLIMVSRFAASKDQETVIKALKYLDEDVTLRLVGDGENLSYCKEVSVKEGVSDRVHFGGARSDIADMIAESYIGIQSSNWEGFGLTAVEIMAAGKPVIVSNVDGLKQVVEGAGIIFNKGDEKDLAKKVELLLSDKTLYEEMAKKCNKRAREYDISLMAEKYKNIYLK